MIAIQARPEPVNVDLRKSALVVVDMQNAFASKGGMLDLAGADISGAGGVVRSIRRLLEASRRSGMQVVYLQVGYKPDLSDGGGDDSPNPHKELAIRLMRCKPELKGQLLIHGTWDFAIVDDLRPEAGDLVIVKTRYSGFTNTALDAELKTRGIRYLFFTGIATNVCVESTLRDAYFLEYWPILIEDATMHAGPPFMQQATVHNVEAYFGWVTGSQELEKLLRP